MAGLLLVIAHPDDEIFCSGLLAHVTSQDIPLHVVCLTRGEGGQLGQPAIATTESLPRVREEEMKQAVGVLNASSLVFLDYIDPQPDGTRLRAPDHDPKELISEIGIQIQKFNPEAVLTHGSTGDYGHPAHVLVHQMTKAAVKKSGGILYSFNAFYQGSGRLGALNRADWATFLFDASTYKSTRFESFWKHATQWPVFVGAQPSEQLYRDTISSYFDTTATESYCRHFGKNAQDPMATWTKEFRREPPDSGALVRMKYSMLWSLRDIARKVKRMIVR